MAALPSRTTVVAGCLSLLVACVGSGEDRAVGPSPQPTSSTTDPSPVVETPTATGPSPSGTAASPACSAGDLAVSAVQPQGLSEAAAATWNGIRDAALACDYEALAALAGEDFTYSFGGGDDPVPYWREAEASGETLMADLVRILGLPAGEDPDGNRVWPRVHVEPDDDAAWDEIAGIHPPEVIAGWREAGSGYLGYRTAIGPDGTWLYFVAGD